MRHILFILLLSLSFALHAQNADALLAVIGKEVITFYDVQQASAVQEAQLKRQYHGRALEEKILELRRQVLQSLIDKELIYLEFKELKANLPQLMLQDRMNAIVNARANGDIKQFEELLMAEGHTIQEFRDRMAKELSVELLVRERTERGIMITNDQIEAFYKEKQETMKTPTRYHVAVIQLAKNPGYEVTVDTIYKELKEGTPFADLAKKYSADANAAEGGDQGWMTGPAPKLLDVIKTLKPGQTAMKPLDMGNNLYIIRLIDIDEGGLLPLNDTLRRKITQYLTTQEEKKRYDAFIKNLYIKYPVRRLDN